MTIEPDVVSECLPDWRALLARLDGAYARTTLTSYAKDIAIFEAFCRKGAIPFLPATPETLVDFITEEAHRVAPATIRRRLCAIEKIHRLARLPSPVTDEDVKIAMRRVYRTRGRRQKQALGLDRELLDQLLDACDPETLLGRRDRALLLIACDSLCRRSELVTLDMADLAPTRDGGMIAIVRRSKADQAGEGRGAFLMPDTVICLRAWCEAAGIVDGPVLRGVRNGRAKGTGLCDGYVSQILKRIARRAGLPAETIAGLSGHSPRVGRAQDLSLGGSDILAIMRAGGWKTIHTVARYVEHAELQRMNSMRLRTTPS